MKLSKLIKQLKKLEKEYGPNTKVLVARDEEGNGFLEVDELGQHKAFFDQYEINLVHPNDLIDFNADELETVIVVWP